jgi:hypothetical protein
MRFLTLTKRLGATLLVGVAAALMLSAGSAVASDKPIKSLAEVAGKWQGSATTTSGDVADVTVTIRNDGTYDASTWGQLGTGKMTLKDGKLMVQGQRGTATATMTNAGQLVVITNMSGGIEFATLKRSDQAPAEKPIKSLAEVAGKWQGTAMTASGDVTDVTVTIRKDGTYDASTWGQVGAGKLTLEDGKLKLEGRRGPATVTMTTKGELVVVAGGGGGGIEFATLRRAK